MGIATHRRLLIPLLILGTCWIPRGVSAAEGTEHVPPTSVLSLRVDVRKLMDSEIMTWLPVEIAQAWSDDNLGLDLMSIEEIQIVSGMMMGPVAPPLGALIRLNKDFDPSNIRADVLDTAFGSKASSDEPVQPQQLGEIEVYEFDVGGEPAYLHMVNSTTVLIATGSMLREMIASSAGSGPLVDLIESNPMNEHGIQLVAAVEPIRQMAIGAANMFGSDLPDPIRDVIKVPELLDAIVIGIGIGSDSSFEITMIAGDDAKAQELHGILVRTIDFGKPIVIEQARAGFSGQGRMVEAQRAYTTRITNKIAAMLVPERVGDRLVYQGESGASIASTGILVGLLLPAVQSAREAARRMSASNNLKQIAIAIHNYHATYKRLPPAAIVDEDGKPLLSWRVALLPFLEQQQLYDQFHLDEPWDSPHNIKFAEMVLPVFQDPSLQLAPGQTVFRAMVGEGLAFSPEGESRFRDFFDGMSNTIMVVEADASESVPWSAPRNLQINLSQPNSQMGHIHPGGFHVMLADGAVTFVSHEVDPETFRALLTRAGRETIQGVGRDAIQGR